MEKLRKSKQLISLQLRIVFFVLLSVAATLSLCSMFRGESDSLSGRYEQNRNLWRKSKIANYKMTLNLRKSGHEGPRGVYAVTVQDGVVTSITIPNPELTDASQEAREYATIERLFSLIEASIKLKPDSLKIEYDPQYGYPKKMDLDRYRDGNDDEFWFEISEFEAL